MQYLTPAFLWEAAAAVAEVAQAAAVAAVARKHWLFASVAATTAVCTYSAAAEMNQSVASSLNLPVTQTVRHTGTVWQ